MLVTYIAIYAKEIGINSGVGLFFSIMAIGLVATRLLGGKLVDKGRVKAVISWGTFICIIGYFTLSSLPYINNQGVLKTVFYSLSLILGLGYGFIFPAYNTLFVNLAPNNRRATASSTYMTSWDIGIGIGLIIGGVIADSTGGYEFSFMVGSLATTFSLIFFIKVVAPHYLKNKLN
jgi:MFS family permease